MAERMNKDADTNAPTVELIRCMWKVAVTLDVSKASLLSAGSGQPIVDTRRVD